MSIFKKIKKEIKNHQDERDKETIARSIVFAKKNPRCVVLVMDIESDDVVIAYKEHYIATRLVSKFMKLKKKIVKNIVLGNMKDKETFKNVEFIKDIVGEFLWQMNEHYRFKKEFDKKLKEGFKGTFREFVESKRSANIKKNNKKKNE